MKRTPNLSAVLTLLSLIVLAAGGCSARAKAQPAPAPVDVAYTLQAAMAGGRMVYIGVGGDIDGITNPDLIVATGQRARITLLNDDGMLHDLAIPDLRVKSDTVGSGGAADVTFSVAEEDAGTHAYYCTISGHRAAGMEGRLIISRAR